MARVKGAGRCPKCGSRKVISGSIPTSGFYAENLEICVNCKAVWEPYDPDQLLDSHMPQTSSFKEPCDNCAFRPGSPEQKDKARWAELMASLKENGRFYCHKGVPIDPKSEHGFAYPTKLVCKELHPTATTEDVKRLRMCRGWLTREWQKWMTRKMYVGIARGPAFPRHMDVAIINYEILQRHRPTIETIAWDPPPESRNIPQDQHLDPAPAGFFFACLAPNGKPDCISVRWGLIRGTRPGASRDLRGRNRSND